MYVTVFFHYGHDIILSCAQDLEERERNLSASQGRAEMAMQTLQRENHYQEEKVKELEKKVILFV